MGVYSGRQLNLECKCGYAFCISIEQIHSFASLTFYSIACIRRKTSQYARQSLSSCVPSLVLLVMTRLIISILRGRSPLLYLDPASMPLTSAHICCTNAMLRRHLSLFRLGGAQQIYFF